MGLETPNSQKLELSVSIIEEAEEHRRQWQAKRRRITPGIDISITVLILASTSL